MVSESMCLPDPTFGHAQGDVVVQLANFFIQWDSTAATTFMNL